MNHDGQGDSLNQGHLLDQKGFIWTNQSSNKSYEGLQITMG